VHVPSPASSLVPHAQYGATARKKEKISRDRIRRADADAVADVLPRDRLSRGYGRRNEVPVPKKQMEKKVMSVLI
jgi:hypothetical protein